MPCQEQRFALAAILCSGPGVTGTATSSIRAERPGGSFQAGKITNRSITRALRLLAVAIETIDDDDGQPVEPGKLLDEERVRADAAREKLRRRGF